MHVSTNTELNLYYQCIIVYTFTKHKHSHKTISVKRVCLKELRYCICWIYNCISHMLYLATLT